MKKAETLLTEFWVITYIASAFRFYAENSNLLVQFWAMTKIISEFDFYEKRKKQKLYRLNFG